MKEEMLEQFRFSDQLKEKLICLIVYKNQSLKIIARQYGLPNVYMLINWVRIYKKTLETGAVTLSPMQPQKLNDTKALKTSHQTVGKVSGKSQCNDLRTEYND